MLAGADSVSTIATGPEPEPKCPTICVAESRTQVSSLPARPSVFLTRLLRSLEKPNEVRSSEPAVKDSVSESSSAPLAGLVPVAAEVPSASSSSSSKIESSPLGPVPSLTRIVWLSLTVSPSWSVALIENENVVSSSLSRFGFGSKAQVPLVLTVSVPTACMPSYTVIGVPSRVCSEPFTTTLSEPGWSAPIEAFQAPLMGAASSETWSGPLTETVGMSSTTPTLTLMPPSTGSPS